MDRHDDDVRWDYDCPQFVDFTAPMPFNDGADQMFERTVLGEGSSTTRFFSQGEMEDETVEHAAPASVVPESETQKAEDICVKTKEVEEEEKVKKAPSNLITSLEEWRKRGKHGSTGPDEGPNSKKVKVTGVTSAMAASKSTSALMRSKSMRVKSSSSTALNSQKPGSRGSSPESRTLRSHACTLSQGRSNSTSNLAASSNARSAKADTSASSKSKPSKMPTLLKRLGDAITGSHKGLSSEDLEMDRIKQMQKELQHKRQLAQQSYKKAMTVSKPLAVHAAKDPTVPQEFDFQSDKRIKNKAEKTEDKRSDFVKMLRSRTVTSPGPSSGPKKLTVPQPFHLSEKPSKEAASGKFESLAETVTAFHRKTPERFRSRARSGEGRARSVRSVSPKLTLTQPHTPALATRSRNRPTHYMSQGQLEEQEVEEMKRSQFKANPVNTKILTNPMTGVHKVPSKPVTQPEEFALSSALPRKKREDEEEDVEYEFHAKPLNKKIFEGPLGVKPVKPALPTVPMSPAFALKHRVRLPVEIPEEKDTSSSLIRAKPVPHTGIPFQPKLPHQRTVPEPFAVEERSKAMLAQREEKIRQALEEEKRAREFHAQPLPSLEPGRLPVRAPKEATKPEPFQLETDERGTLYKQDLSHKVGSIQLEEEEEEQRKAAQFKAQPCRVTTMDPFRPAKSTKPLTEVSDFELNLERRAVQREEFEMHKKAREAELEGLRRQREQRQMEEEEAAIAKLRAEMVHRPNPVRQYKPVVIMPSDKPLTEAESPQFSDRLRSNVRI